MKGQFEVYLTWGAPQILNHWKLIGFKTVIIAGQSFSPSLRLLSFRVRTDIGYLSHLCGRGEGLGVDGWFTGGFVQLIVHCCPSTGHREDVVVTVGDCRRWQLQVPPFLSSRGGRGSWGATRISGPVTIANIFFVVFLDHWPTMRGETLFSSTTSGNCLF